MAARQLAFARDWDGLGARDAEAVAILDAVLALDAPQPHEETLRRMRNGAAERAGRSGTGS
jgi:hypothetical protein